MKINRLSALAGAGALSLVAIVCMLFWGFRRKEPSPQPSSSPSSISAASVPEISSVAGITRVLSEWQGKLAVFLEGNPTPDEVFDVYIASLPVEEQKRLKAGIRVSNDTELARYLEDYTS